MVNFDGAGHLTQRGRIEAFRDVRPQQYLIRAQGETHHPHFLRMRHIPAEFAARRTQSPSCMGHRECSTVGKYYKVDTDGHHAG